MKRRSPAEIACLVLLFSVLVKGDGSLQKNINICLKEMQQHSINIINKHVKGPMHCSSHQTNHECIFKWINFDSKSSERSVEKCKRKDDMRTIQKQLKLIMKTRTCGAIERHVNMTYPKSDRTGKFFRCWCYFIQNDVP